MQTIAEFRERPVIHATDLRTYFDCRRKFMYSILERLKPISHENPEYFDFGTKGHEILSAHYSKEADPIQIIAEIDNPEHQSHLRVLYDLYRKEYEKSDSNFQIASVEQKIRIDLKGFLLEFTMDLLVLNRPKNQKPFYQIIDHKFLKSFPNTQVLTFDFQITFYIWAARKFGISVNELVYNVIRKSAPEYPTPLKTGGLSRAQTALAKTEYEMYLWSIKELGLNENDYKQELDFLKARGSNILRRFPVRRTDNELESFENDLLTMLDEIHSDREDPNKFFYPTPSLSCGTCAFHILCQNQNNKGNVEGTREMFYERKADDER